MMDCRALKTLVPLFAVGCIGLPTVVGPDDGPDVAPDAAPDLVADAADHVDADSGGDRDMGAPPPSFVAIAMGDTTVCALADDGAAVCWGANESRLLLPDDDKGPLPPTRHRLIDGFSALAAGATHMCGIVGNRVACWGGNAQSQVRDPPNPSMPSPTALVLGPLTMEPPIAVSAGNHGSCSAHGAAGVICWGGNSTRAVDPSTAASPLTPSLLEVGDVRDVAIGAEHTCALMGDGRVMCWGQNSDGRAVPETAAAALITTPTFATSREYTKLDADDFTCAVTGGRVDCWGDNLSNRLGSNVSRVGAVTGVTTATDVAVGANHACALLADGSVSCWGEWAPGRADAPLGFRRPGGGAFQILAAGDRVTCAAAQSSIWCWGTNSYGGVGLYDDIDNPVPGVYDEPIPVAFEF